MAGPVDKATIKGVAAATTIGKAFRLRLLDPVAVALLLGEFDKQGFNARYEMGQDGAGWSVACPCNRPSPRRTWIVRSTVTESL